MHNAVLRFTTKWPWNPTSLVVSRLSGSRDFSHSMVLHGGKAYEATMLHGCRAVPEAKAMAGVVAYQDMPLLIPDLAASLAFGQRLADDRTPYDFAGAFGLPVLASEDWQDEGSYWCSEHNFMMLWKGGLLLLDPEIYRRVTPEHLRMTNNRKTPITYLRKPK